MKESCKTLSEQGRSEEDIDVPISDVQPNVHGENHDGVEEYDPWMLVDQ